MPFRLTWHVVPLTSPLSRDKAFGHEFVKAALGLDKVCCVELSNSIVEHMWSMMMWRAWVPSWVAGR